MEMQFKLPLRSGDSFVSKIALRKDGLKYVFYHDLYRLPDNRLVHKSVVTTVCLVNGRLSACPELDDIFFSPIPF